MLRVEFDILGDVYTFKCPKCNAIDVVYTGMPCSCYACGKTYRFNILSLMDSQDERMTYYKYKVTVAQPLGA